jgi:hypothetical protein
MPMAPVGRGLLAASVATMVAACSLILPPPTTTADASPARWTVDPAQPPGPEDTSFSALVQEVGCSGGREIEGKLLPPVVEYGDDAIVIRLFLEPLARGFHTCPLRHPTKFTVPLAEPIGERELIDGNDLPGLEAR